MQTNGQKQNKDVDPLPAIDSDFWQVGEERAENAIHTLREVTCTSGEHYFAHLSTREVECIKCHIGFTITGDFSVQGGHIYNEDELVI